MKIGYAVQGSTDRAFLRGLRDRWCSGAELVEGAFRGSTGLSLRRELAKICDDLFKHKGCEVIVFLSDADTGEWRDVQRNEVAKLPDRIRAFVVYGMADRNIECWLCGDPQYIASKTGRAVAAFRAENPKGAFESAMGITRDDKKEDEIASLVSEAPPAVLKTWYGQRSFKDFFDQLWAVGRQRGCEIENLRETATPQS
ncbi:MAG TPA: hypothetical protein PKK06_01385 [Phycisphaerae bacterium]|nr:hypothetical protein [Phycisphaerae bacterium]HNU46649.1 hypothetical protein [Phycisphaerae bacterium]